MAGRGRGVAVIQARSCNHVARNSVLKDVATIRDMNPFYNLPNDSFTLLEAELKD
jgi:hypothetical protein